jgi:hypothetical protein
VRDKHFPPPIKLLGSQTNTVKRMNRWLLTDVKTWVEMIEAGNYVNDIKWDEVVRQKQQEIQKESELPYLADKPYNYSS